MDIDYEKLSEMVVDKLSEKDRLNRDDEFIGKLVDAMVAHRSPCHELDEKQVESIKEVIKKAKKLDKGITFISWGLLLYILKTAWDFFAINIHWTK